MVDINMLNEKEDREFVANSFEKNYFVEAGAGAGKSTLIVDRIINQILAEKSPLKADGPILLTEIAAITFTEKAAIELQFKFQKKLRQRIKEETDSNKKSRLETALKNIDSMFINTVHAFCSKILLENPFQADLTIGFKVMDEKANTEFKNKVWEAFITSEEVIKGNSKTEKLRMEGIAPNDLKEFFFNICESQSLGLDMNWDENFNNSYPRIIEMFKELHDYINDLEEERFKKISKVSPGNILDEIFAEQGDKQKKLAIDFIKHLSKLKQMSDLFLKKEENSKEFKEINELFNINEVTYFEYIYNISTDFVVDAYSIYDKEKKKQMLVSFNDLLYKTFRLLETSEEARNYVSSKFKCIYVDEFQDTDPLQTKILFLITSQNKTEDEWLNCIPTPGSLFVVGDPKQSIYRFRQADISLYSTVKKLVQNQGWGIIDLKWNFRTNPEICDWVSQKFMLVPNDKDTEDKISKIGSASFYLNDECKPYQTTFSGMEAQTMKASDTSILNGVYKFNLGVFNEGEKELILEKDSNNIANWIADQVKNNIEIYQVDKDSKENYLRPIKYGDFLILLRNKKDMGSYLRSLKDRGIPVTFAGEVSLYEIEEAANLIDIVSFLNDQRNTIKVLGVLKNCFGIDITTINAKEIYQASFEDDFLNDFKTLSFNRLLTNKNLIDKINHIPLKNALRKITEYLSWKNSYEPITVVEKIVHDFEVLLKEKYDRVNFRSAVGTLYYMVELLKQETYNSFCSLAIKLEDMKELDIDREMPLEYEVDPEGDYNSVRIMNLHKAKGLEGNIVILAKPFGDRNMGSKLHIERNFKKEYIHLCVTKKAYKNTATLGTPPNWNEKLEAEKLFSEAEKLRLLYVAATRAAKVLVISDGKLPYSPNPWKFLTKEVKEDVIKIKELPTSENKNCIQDLEEHDLECQFELDKIEPLSLKSYYEITPSKLEKIKKTSEDKEIQNEDTEEEVEEDVQNQLQGPYGSTWGTIVHRMLELYIHKIIENKELTIQGQEIIIKRAIRDSVLKKDLNEKTLKQLKLSQNILELSESEMHEEITKKLKSPLHEIIINFQTNDYINKLLTNTEQIIPEMPFYIEINKETTDLREGQLFKLLINNNKEITKELDLDIVENCKKIRVSGIMDLVLRTGNQYTIIDYKTNHYRPGLKQYLREEYHSQLIIYKLILELMTGGEVESLIIHSTVIDEQILVFNNILEEKYKKHL